MTSPLLQPWDGPHGLPPFAALRDEDFLDTFQMALDAHRRRIDGIAANAEAPSFANTIEAMELAGTELDRVGSVFFNLVGVNSNPVLRQTERDVSPLLARHRSAIYLNADLFRRVDTLWNEREKLGLDAEKARVLERYHTHFRRAGAQLQGEARKRLAEIMERLAVLGTQFGQNLLADEAEYQLELIEADLAGLPHSLVQASAQAASERGKQGKHVITLSRSSVEPFLQFSARRDLREQIFEAWIKRGENGGATDNRAIISEMVGLRAERAKLLGYDSFAQFRIDDTMAKTPDAVTQLLDRVWRPARQRAKAEADDLGVLAAAEGGNAAIAPSDWRYYAEKLRKQRYDFDEAELKPYLQLDRMIEAAFYCAERLFGLHFAEVTGIALHHADARLWEVTDAKGLRVGHFIGDYFARASKRSGAWMSSFRSQQKLGGDVTPIIINVTNFAKPPAGEKALLSFDDARTLFHEFGHALHGMLSCVTYPLIAGTSVARDFVELPSQLYEHWLEQPEVLGRFALHVKTGEPMPKALLDKVLAARNFNQGFATVEYTSSALVDLDIHMARPPVDVMAVEGETLHRISMPNTIVMRHRSPHFGHIFSGEGYAAGYYSYLWSEVLDADAFAAFRETGDIFDPATAERLHRFIYSAGGLRAPDDAYRAFRGRMPTPDALLEKRGLASYAEAG